MTHQTPPPCPTPCPEFCTRPEGHGLYVAGTGEWRRIHLGDPVYPGPVCLGQSETVAADGTVSYSSLRLDGPGGSVEITAVARHAPAWAAA